ncbi:MAG: sugar-binding domain-containing protein [Chitinophagaceae bacterium]
MLNAKYIKSIFISLITFWLSFSVTAQNISLAGTWTIAIDKENTGIKEKWYNKTLKETIILPGSMAENGKGDDITLQTKWTGSIYDSSFFFRPSLAKYRTPENLKIPFWLTPAKYYVGAAWYQKQIIIPKNWEAKSLRLYLERTHFQIKVWMDEKEIGSNNSLAAPHEFLLKNSKAGKHTITIRIDNSIKEMNVGPDSHSVSDHTQGNWNGMIGKMYLELIPPVSISNLQVYPDVKNKKIKFNFSLLIDSGFTEPISIRAHAKSFNTTISHTTKSIFKEYIFTAGSSTEQTLELPMGNNFQQWDEFNPALYLLNIEVKTKSKNLLFQKQFGMREFGIDDTRFTINGRPVFLRGTLNNCEFPLTGYPAMNEEAWLRIFRIAKAHGLNHMRFHSWCPPEAAFKAADKIGFYLQPEAPTWPNHGTSVGDGRFIDQYIYDETNRMVNAYGNYASFCMMAAGNEPAGRNQAKYLADFVNYWKAKDKRRVYTGASVAMSWPLVPENEFMVKSGPRGLRWTETEPENATNYYTAIKDFNIPYITHEMGQWCVFPDFDEIKKYTGVYRAKNFELFQDNLKEHGMAGQAKDFLMASGKLQALCYKAELEKDLRTNGLAGFQLLGLQDFPGQGTALIGLLNAFWESKPYFTEKQFSRFCNSTVPLAKMKKFVFTTNETFNADIELFHFGKAPLTNQVISWKVVNDANNIIEKGAFGPQNFALAGNQSAGKISLPLQNFKTAAHYKLIVFLNGTSFLNDWDFWVFPDVLPTLQPADIYITDSIDKKAEEILFNGGKVLLQAAGKVIKGKEVVMYFTPVFWNTSWFKMRPPHVTGMLIKNNHPALKEFPTAYHSDYQWWGIANKAQVMHLEDFPAGFTPIIQPIDTWFMNRKLGLLFEAKAGNGKLIVCSAPVSDTSANPANRQLFYSIKKYMSGKNFSPAESVNINTIKDLFISPSKETWDSFTKDSPDELKPIKTNPVKN